MLRRIPLLLSLAAVALTVACGGDDPAGPRPDDVVRPFEAPVGRAFVLPANITLQAPLAGTGADGMEEGERCHWQNAGEAGYSYQYVNVCMTLRNTRATDDTLDLPTGLVFISENGDVQNGLVVQPIAIRIPAGRDTTVLVRLWCANLERASSDLGDTFRVGPVTSVPGITEIATLLRGKVIDGDAVEAIQDAVWEVSDEGGLTAASRAALRALANE